jgi:hypothetical protein
MIKTTVIALAVIAFGGSECAAAVSALQEKGIDADTIRSFEELGAVYGGFSMNKFGYVSFVPGTESASRGLPGFSLPSRRELDKRVNPITVGSLPKLPIVNVPFGLDLFGTAVADEGLQQLETFSDRLFWDDKSGQSRGEHLE